MRETLELSKQVLGERAAQTQTYMHNLAGFVGLQGRYEEALVLLERCVELRMETLGETHWRTLRSRVTQAQTLGEMGAGEAALQLLREVLDISRAELGAAHIETQQTALELGRQLFRMGAAEEAFGVLEGQWRALVGAGRAGVDARPQVITLRFEMAFILAAQGRRDDAWSIADEALGLALQALGPEHPETRYVARWLVGQLLDAGHAADAEAVRARLTTAR